MRVSKLGTIVRLSDGRTGTVVYNSLDGVGIKWGVHYPPQEDFIGTTGSLFSGEPPNDWPWYPDAMLREAYPGCSLECVGSDYEIVEEQEE